ncbi:hypothetical protein G6011_00049 [Alternaria panax]|uniref:F-box domain-containing protein n=1 Tax=Alternaria panax TaxID=48097 RepID=A0AAD4IIG8_9PLEO|nr:hypothetical protein G6011_00049 [Alternaria panax]
MASFCLLPTELVEYIVSYLPQHDIYAVCQLNKALSNLAIPFLYRRVDLFIPAGSKIPRIDRFCLAIINSTRKANNVKSIRLGLSSSADLRRGQRWLPPDKNFDDRFMFRKAMTALSNETLVAAGDYLRDAISMREYSAYAALILLVLPSLHCLDIADYKNATLEHLHSILRNLDPGTPWNKRYPSRILLTRLSSIKKLSLVFDRKIGVAYSGDNSRITLDHFLNIPGIQTLELSNQSGNQHVGTVPALVIDPMVNSVRATNITTLVFRHSGALTPTLHSLLRCVPQLRSFTYDFFFRHQPVAEGSNRNQYMLMLDSWTEVLATFTSTLEVLVFSAEYCDKDAYFFHQPRINEKMYGYLDLTAFTALHTLECPVPFLTGDTKFSITREIYPLFPPALRHVTLRPDLSHASAPFPFDESRLERGLTFDESKEEAQWMMNARMDTSYMFQAALSLLEYLPELESIAVWQPADPRLEWFEGQVQDFATTCTNKNITGSILKPMVLRWKNAVHWDLMKETRVFDREMPQFGTVNRFWREEWKGRPLGLGCQYHLDALGSRKIRMRR